MIRFLRYIIRVKILPLRVMTLCALICLSGGLYGQDESKLFRDSLIQTIIDIRNDIIYNKSREQQRKQQIEEIFDKAPLTESGKTYLKNFFLEPDPNHIFSLEAEAHLDGVKPSSIDFLEVPILMGDSTDRGNWLLDGMNYLEVLEEEYPYKLKDLKLITQELQSYNITNGFRVADLGAGSGAISLLIASLFEDVELFIHEINKGQLHKLARMFVHAYSIKGSNQLEFTLGSDKSTNLEGKDLDIIIMRHMLHHVKNKNRYLNSVQKSLTADGRLYIVEYYKNKEADKPKCKKLLGERRIRKLLENAGFDILKTRSLGKAEMLTCIKGL